MQSLDSFQTITYIQLSTHHDCFSLAQLNLIFFCLSVRTGFHLAFLDGNPILFSQLLTVLLQTLTPVLTYLFYCKFLFSIQALSFLSKGFDVFLCLLVVFIFFYNFISFIFAPNFRHIWLGTTNIFCHTPLWITFFKEFHDPFYCFNRVCFLLEPYFLSIMYEVCKNCLLNVNCICRLLLVFI